jgi:hypothetical protein
VRWPCLSRERESIHNICGSWVRLWRDDLCLPTPCPLVPCNGRRVATSGLPARHSPPAQQMADVRSEAGGHRVSAAWACPILTAFSPDWKVRSETMSALSYTERVQYNSAKLKTSLKSRAGPSGVHRPSPLLIIFVEEVFDLDSFVGRW